VRYRHAWPGFLLLGSLALLLGALLVWGDHFLSPGPSGGIRRLLTPWAASRPPRDTGLTAGEEKAALPEAPGRPAPPDERGQPVGVSEPPPPAVTASEPMPSKSAGKKAPAAVVPPRYALDLGTFAMVEEAERAEALLNQAGFSTVRFLQQAPEGMFSVLLPPPRDAEEGRAILARLRESGFTQVSPLEADQGLSLRVARAIPLRLAAQLAERLRTAGFEPRVTAEADEQGQVTLRHGNFASRDEAEAIGRAISRLGVPNEVVEIR
jgi:cell division septation protein DedD